VRQANLAAIGGIEANDWVRLVPVRQADHARTSPALACQAAFQVICGWGVFAARVAQNSRAARLGAEPVDDRRVVGGLGASWNTHCACPVAGRGVARAQKPLGRAAAVRGTCSGVDGVGVIRPPGPRGVTVRDFFSFGLCDTDSCSWALPFLLSFLLSISQKKEKKSYYARQWAVAAARPDVFSPLARAVAELGAA
jgi:hypothetical protein